MSLIIAKPTKPTKAQEAKDSNEFKVGDKVRYSYSVHGADVDDIFKVVKVIDYQKVIIKRIRDGKEWDEFDYNLVAVKASAQDSGNYATNTIALLRTALGNLRTAYSVVSRALSNIGNAMSKVQDAQAKSSLKSMQQEWWECEREIWDTMEKVERIPVPSGHGVPNKAKLSPEDRAFIKEFFE